MQVALLISYRSQRVKGLHTPRTIEIIINKHINICNPPTCQASFTGGTETKTAAPAHTPVNVPNTGGTEIVEMDRMRKLISAHMTMSKQTSAHITSFVEADMTNIVNWRESVKHEFKRREWLDLWSKKLYSKK